MAPAAGSAALSGNLGAVHSAANAVDLELAAASAGPTILEVANRLFPDDDFSMLPWWLVGAEGLEPPASSL